MAINAFFSQPLGVLFELGDDADDTIVTGSNPAGKLTVNDGSVKIKGGKPSVSDTSLIWVDGGGGDDVITLDETNGPLPPATLSGGTGDDTITAGSGADQLFGGDGDDRLDGRGGSDLLVGGAGNDVLTGGGGDDQLFGEGGNDLFVWSRGDGNDMIEGGDGVDTAQVNGSGEAETFTITANGTRVRVDRIAPEPSSALDIGTVESVVINAGGGDDQISATGNLAALTSLTIDGGAGNDTILGGNGADLLIGGEGNDFVDGQQGNDVAFLGAGDDVFQWDPGDGSDTVEGQAGADTLQFNGSAGAEIIAVSANGGRALLTRNLGNIVMDLNDVETIRVAALGNTDVVTVNDLAGTDVTSVQVDLSGTLGGSTDDAQVDQVQVNGTGAANAFTVSGSGGVVTVGGLTAAVSVANGSALDSVWVNGLGGNDVLSTAVDLTAVMPVVFAGGDGTDSAQVNGGDAAETFTIAASGERVRIDRIAPSSFALETGAVESVVINAGGGDDQISATGNLAALTSLTIDGGAGNDTILGGNGADLLIGGEGNDFVDGQQGNDVAFLGAGDDVFQWDPGDGSDTVEGQAGTDALRFNGSNGAEIIAISANGGRALLTRNLGNIVMDLNDVERIELNALGNTDTVIVGDLSGTDVTQVSVDLSGTIGGTAGDAAADTVIANGTNGDDVVQVFGSGSSIAVAGLAAQLNVANSEGANDSLVINTLGGNDQIAATTLAAGMVKLTIDAGAGDDTILGNQGADVLLGGDGSDFILGDGGNDLALMGAGDDVFQWDPGDGSDTIEGQAGADRLLFHGSGASENVDIVANGGRALLFRNVGAVTMDMDDVERIALRALGGSDNIVVGDLTGTDVTRVDIDLGGSAGGGDGAADTVTVSATQGADAFGVSGDAGGVGVFGLQAATNILFQEQANDRLVLNAFGGDDVIDATGLDADGIQLTVNGGLGADVFLGSEGDDLFAGGDGNDLALGGAGDDVFVWNPGDDNDVLEGQAGFDTMRFNGANVAENISISANGARVISFRDVASVTMDLNDVESIDYRALGGADTITVNDMSGTDVTEVNIDLAASAGGGDGAADTIIINATQGDDVIVVVGDGSGVSVLGLASRIDIANFDPTMDRLVINALGGSDVVEASGLAAGSIQFTADGGDGDDVLIGGDGNDVLLGGAGDDVLLGGLGIDVLDGGTDDNVVIQSAVAPTTVGDLYGLPGDESSLLDAMAGTGDLQPAGSTSAA